MPDAIDVLRQKVAISMRILAHEGLVREITGHVSARIPGADEMFVRCRGGNERGLLYTDVQQIRRVDFDGKGEGLGPDHMAPLELPIHGELYRARPSVRCVVHAHPWSAVMCGILGLDIRPIWGAFDPSGYAIARAGVPVFPRSILVAKPETAAAMMAAMGERDCCIMKGHGITVAGTSVESATLLALRLERLARMTVEMAQTGRDAPTISEEDMAFFGPEPGSGSGPVRIPRAEEWTWAHYTQLVRDSVGIPEDFDPA